jgi:sulfonate transport system ATP-binding protein
MPWKTVFGNVAFATDDPSGKSTSAGVVAALGRVGLAERLDDWPKNLSGGEAARVAIARALIARPAMLLLDEPFQSLDLITRYEVEQQLLLALAAARPMVLLVSHDIEDAVFLSDTVHILSYRPMRIARTFSVPLPYPRLRGDGALSAIANEIAAFLAAASHGVPAVS